MSEGRYETSKDYQEGYDLGRYHGRDEVISDVLALCLEQIHRAEADSIDAASAHLHIFRARVQQLDKDLRAGV